VGERRTGKGLKHGDVIEVVKDFDPKSLSPGDRVIHRADNKRWYFSTRIPPRGASPIYDVDQAFFDRGWIKVVDHVDDVPKQGQHKVLRPERETKFIHSMNRFVPDIRKLWKQDKRYKEFNNGLDLLVRKVLQAESGLTVGDVAYDFFVFAHNQQASRGWTVNIVGRSVKRLERKGNIVKDLDFALGLLTLPRGPRIVRGHPAGQGGHEDSDGSVGSLGRPVAML
jgi:hypothetical protein